MSAILITDKTGKFQYRKNPNGTVAVVKCLEPVSDLRIPEILDNFIVTSLSEYAIELNEHETVYIPQTISYIEPAAFLSDHISEVIVDQQNPWFRMIDGMLVETATGSVVFYPPEHPASSLTIPEGILTIQDFAFSGCVNLKQVILPESLQSIGYEAFEHCEELTDLYIPSAVSYIGDYAFDDCPKLRLLVHEDVYHKMWGYFREFEELDFELVKKRPSM